MHIKITSTLHISISVYGIVCTMSTINDIMIYDVDWQIYIQTYTVYYTHSLNFSYILHIHSWNCIFD